MGAEWTYIIDAIGKTYVVSGLIPLGLGGVINLLKWWVIGEEECRRRIALLRETLTEKQVTSLAGVLTQTQSLRPIAEIREADGGADPIELYVKMSFVVLHTHRKLEQLLSRVRTSYTALMWATVLSLLALLGAVAIEAARPAAAIFCYLLVAVQTAIFIYLRRLKSDLENNEDAA